jgi:hypothetical protein
MSARMLIELPSGHKVLFGGGGPRAGLADVGLAERTAAVASGKFENALGSLADLVAALEQSVGKMVHRPDKVQLEFGATLTADCDLWIVSGKGEAELKVTLSWGKGGD